MINIKNKRKTIPPKTAIKNILADFSRVSLIEKNPKAKLKYVINPARMKDFKNPNDNKLTE
jgi:hypothetical protein